MKTSQIGTMLGLSMAALFLAGCNTDPLTQPPGATGRVDSKVSTLYTPEAPAGVALTPEEAKKDMDTVYDISRNRSWSTRGSNAFGLLASERKFEQEQSLERILNDSGGFMSEFELPEESTTEERPQSFPTPAWRLAGIVVSEGAVIALLDQGTRVDTIVPGQMVEGTEWRCVGIDTEKAVFRRDPRRVPSEIVVPLQGGLPGALGGGNAPSGGNNNGRGARGGSQIGGRGGETSGGEGDR